MESSEGIVRGLAGVPVTPEKLRIPTIAPPVLPRPRLYATLDAATGPIVLVAGVAGSGKSTLLASWAAERASGPNRVAWMELDREDNDPETFWTYACAALQSPPHAVGSSPPANPGSASRPPGPSVFLEALRGSTAEVLVLDNAHELRNPVLLEQLRRVFDHVPVGRRLVLSCRRTTGLPLARARLAGRLVELDADALACSRAEIAAYGALASPAPPTPDTVSRLADATGGWPAGLRFAGLQHAGSEHEGSQHAGAEVFGPDDPAVMEYLDGEVFDDQPSRTRDLLAATAWFDPVPRGLAEALLGSRAVARAYPDLTRLRPLVRCDRPDWTTLRFTSLFRAYLVERPTEQPPGRLAWLRRRAASWYRDAGRLAEAARAAIARRDWELLAALTAEDEFGHALGGLLRSVPAAAVETDPRLIAAAGRAHLAAGDDRRAEHLVRLLEARPDQEVSALELRLHASTLRGLPGEPARERARALQAVGRETPALVVRLAEAELAAGRPSSARRALDQPLDVAPGVACRAATRLLGLCCALDGSLAYAETLLAPADPEEPSAGPEESTAEPDPPDLGDLGIVVVALERDRLSGLEERLDAIGRAAPPDGVLARGLVDVLRIRLATLRGSLADARRRLAQVRRSRPVHGSTRGLAEAYAVDLALAEGRLADAAKGIARLPAGPARAARLGWLRLAENDPDAALDAALESAPDPTRQPDPDPDSDPDREHRELGSRLDRIAAHLVAGVAGRATRDPERMRRSVDRALELAEPEGAVTVFLTGGRPVRHLLTVTATAEDPYADFRRTVLRHFDLQAVPGGGAIPVGLRARARPSLTDSERAVLAYLPSQLSNAEIAADLYLSVNTVKSHLRTLYRKLGVSSRRDATARARAYDLLA